MLGIQLPISSITLLATIIINAILGLFLFFKSERNWSALFLFLIILSIFFWAVPLFLYEFVCSQKLALNLSKIAYFAAGLSSIFSLDFTVFFVNERKGKKKKNRKWNILVFLSNLIGILFLIICLFKNLLLSGFKVFNHERIIAFGRLYPFYIILISIFFIFSFYILYRNYNNEKDPLRKKQIQYIFIGMLIAVTGGVITNLIFPTFHNFSLYWVGPLFTLAMAGFLVIAILKHHLFDIKIIATEIFVIALLSVFLINTLNTDTWQGLVFNVVIFISAVIFSILLIRSVSREIEIRNKLVLAYEKLKKVDKTKTEFISMASHQLRTPLTSIKGYISMLLEGDYGEIKEEQKKILRNVFFSNERLIRIVNDLLNVSRIELGKMNAQKEKADIVSIVKNCVEEMKQEADKKGLEILFKKQDKGEKIFALVDILKIRQAIINIIDNAIHYTEKGKVEVGVKKGNSSVIIYIKDTGQGFSAEDKEKIFEEFGRGKAGLNLFVGGSGLGLYIVKKYMDLHKGKVWAESKGKGKGSTFYLKIPTD